MKETVVIIDGGGRGHTLARKYLENPNVNVIGIPGNDFWKVGYGDRVETFPNLKTTDKEAIAKIAEEKRAALVDVAQDNAVAVGTVDLLQERGIPALGPTRAAGRLEWSKAYSRELATVLGIPQPHYQVFHSMEAGVRFVEGRPNKSFFIKADGLAEGKGAVPAKGYIESLKAITQMKRFGSAGETYLIEEWLKGENEEPIEEYSAFYLNGHYLGSVRDHKRVNEGDEGENTGGMGCSTPHTSLRQTHLNLTREYAKSFGNALSQAETPYHGIMYLGMALVKREKKFVPHLIEVNSRWGDPEAQVLIPGIKNDFLELGLSAIEDSSANLRIQSDKKARVAIAGVSKGYPGDYSRVKGKEIHGLKDAMKWPDVTIIGAGIKVADGRYFANGGRLFYVVGEGEEVCDAQSRALEAIEMISVDGENLHYRRDIGDKDC